MNIFFKSRSVRFFMIFEFLTFICLSDIRLQASNKDRFRLCEENFSKDSTLNLKGLSKHIHYTFKNETLLKEALYPLLASDHRQTEQRFQHLEFLGDAVLGLVARERILDLFPQESRKVHVKLYEELTKNKTLSEVYQKNLKIERYLPYPGANICEYCNIIESLIGAIFEDDQDNSLVHARKFVSLILNDHVLKEKWHHIQQANKERSQIISQSLPLLPLFKKILVDLSDRHTTDSKSMLGIILQRSSQDEPEYHVILGRNLEGTPGFKAQVIGAHIGNVMSGFGLTKVEAEQEAARQAINFLANEEYIPAQKNLPQIQLYFKVVHEYCQIKNIQLLGSFKFISPQFTYIAQWEGKKIGQGEAISKKKAAEMAASQAYEYLLKNNQIEQISHPLLLNYKMKLNEWLAQGKIKNYQLIEQASSLYEYQYHLKIDDKRIEEKGSLKEEVRDKAYQAAFDHLLLQQANREILSYQQIQKNPSINLLTPNTTPIRVKAEDKICSSKLSQSDKNSPIISANKSQKPLTSSLKQKQPKKVGPPPHQSNARSQNKRSQAEKRLPYKTMTPKTAPSPKKRLQNHSPSKIDKYWSQKELSKSYSYNQEGFDIDVWKHEQGLPSTFSSSHQYQ